MLFSKHAKKLLIWHNVECQGSLDKTIKDKDILGPYQVCDADLLATLPIDLSLEAKLGPT